MRMSHSLKTIKGRVASILENYPETRDSDKLLWLAYLNLNHNLRNVLDKNSYFQFTKILMADDTPSFESIRRIRQKFQEHGFYQGKNRSYRMKESDLVRNWSRS